MTYRAGIIGCGRIASLFEDQLAVQKPCTHAGAYSLIPEIDLVAACDIRQDRLNKCSNRWGIKKLYLDYTEMLKKENLDILSICTHAPEHHEICLAAAESGVRVIFCEKPMATSLKEAEEMIEVCRKNNVILAVDHTRRWDDRFIKVKKIIESGEIEQVDLLDCYTTVGLLNGGTHLFDLMRFYCGEVESVTGYIKRDKSTDPGGIGLVRFKNGANAFVDSSWRDYVLFGINIYGMKGMIKSFGMIRSNKDIVKMVPKDSIREPITNELQDEEIITEGSKSPLYNAIKNLIGCLENGKNPSCTGEDGMAALEIALAFHESENQGHKEIFLPLKNRELKVIPRETSFTKNGKINER